MLKSYERDCERDVCYQWAASIKNSIYVLYAQIHFFREMDFPRDGFSARWIFREMDRCLLRCVLSNLIDNTSIMYCTVPQDVLYRCLSY